MNSELKKQRTSLVARLSTWIAIFFSAGAIILFFGLRAFLAHHLLSQDKEIILQEAHEYINAFEEGGQALVEKKFNEDIQSADYFKIYVSVLLPDGKIAFESDPQTWSKFDIKGLSKLGNKNATGWHEIPQAQPGESILDIVGLHVKSGAVILAGMSSESRDDFIEGFSAIFFEYSMLTILISSLAGFLISRSALKPLLHFRDVIGNISKSANLDIRIGNIDRLSYREIDDLKIAFNSLLERINRLVESMHDGLDTIAHEIKSPLTRLRIKAENSLRSGEISGQIDSLADSIEETERITKIVDTIMDVAEAEGQIKKLSLNKFKINEVLKKVQDLYEDAALSRNIKLNISFTNDIEIKGDFLRLVQAVSNLVDNAIKFTASKGEIKISTDNDENFTYIRIEDQGIGIPPGEIPLIWHRLYRGKDNATRPGLGLGLALVKAVVHAHGGRVKVESIQGIGSIFTITLPLKK